MEKKKEKKRKKKDLACPLPVDHADETSGRRHHRYHIIPKGGWIVKYGAKDGSNSRRCRYSLLRRYLPTCRPGVRASSLGRYGRQVHRWLYCGLYLAGNCGGDATWAAGSVYLFPSRSPMNAGPGAAGGAAGRRRAARAGTSGI